MKRMLRNFINLFVGDDSKFQNETITDIIYIEGNTGNDAYDKNVRKAKNILKKMELFDKRMYDNLVVLEKDDISRSYCRILYDYINLKEQKGISTAELSVLCNLSDMTIIRFENISNIIQLNTYLKIMETLKNFSNKN